jgi:phosphate transporter
MEAEALACHAQLAHGGDVAASKRELDRKLDDVVHFNRANVWREQALLERGRLAANVTPAHADPTPWLRRPIGVAAVLLLAAFVFALLLTLPTMEHRNQRNCLAMLVLLSILWCTEVIPLYVTSMLVPVLTVLLGVLPHHQHPDRSMPAEKAAHKVFEVCRLCRCLHPFCATPSVCRCESVGCSLAPGHWWSPVERQRHLSVKASALLCRNGHHMHGSVQAMFSPVIMLLLGGFAIAAALSKHYIAKAAAASILSRVSKPNSIVLATMFVATFASMWISNVAAPVLCFSLVQPILRRQTYEGLPLSKVRL